MPSLLLVKLCDDASPPVTANGNDALTGAFERLSRAQECERELNLNMLIRL